MKYVFFVTCVFISSFLNAQSPYWQQRVSYVMDIDMDVNTNRFKGKQKLTYTNNSPDVLKKLYYHLYFNAFQPNSSMDVRSRELGNNLINGKPDWDPRVKDRISKLTEDEIGYQKINSLKLNGVNQKFHYRETILEVDLTTPIAPGAKVVLDMDFEAQVPLQVRRSGRDNPVTGVRYSMSQWYPKLCEYDAKGWHNPQYIAREFYGVWGDFDVTIHIDKDYKIGGTGVLQNAAEIGWGYDKSGTELKPTAKAKRSWKFTGKNIHDFVWAADPDYRHLVRKTSGGTVIHVLYNFKENNPENDSAWTKVADAAVAVLPYVEKNYGKYPYPQYSFIQGGDGGMEYAMATLLTGPSLGTAFHELMHSWYQMVLGINESLYPWMDEGFTNFSEDLVMKSYTGRSSLQSYRDRLKAKPNDNYLQEMTEILPEDHSGAYESYYALVRSGLEEPLTTHADHYNTNFAYSIASYSKGEIFLEQLGYVVGSDTRDKIMMEFYDKWKFKHPDADNFIRVAEKVSGIQLDWYKQYWVNTTKTIDYAIDSLWEADGRSHIRISRKGDMPMPVDIRLTFKDSSMEMHCIPLNLMFGRKADEDKNLPTTTHEAWRWTHPTYTFSFTKRISDLTLVEIDPSNRMADVQRKNNRLALKW